ncbi:MAG: RNA polymerase sigma factor [Cumulibacter sp.]
MSEVLERVVREDWGRLVALLLARYGRLDLVEDAIADAVESAARRWPIIGVPANPPAWLHTAARRRLLDRLGAEAIANRKAPQLVASQDRDGPRVMADPGGLIADDVLRLVLMCAHPALAPEAASALALRLVLGVTTPEIARLFLVSESTMAARLTRAKKKIVTAGIPFAVPDADVLPQRLEIVAQTAYLAFTAGYAPGSGPDPVRVDLAGESIRLVRVVRSCVPHEPSLTALLTLQLLQHSRRDARVSDDGMPVLLPEQNRAQWHHDEIDEALELLRSAELAVPVSAGTASRLLQAHIAAEHAIAPSPKHTRWDRIVARYDELLRLDPSPSAALARAVAVAEHRGPTAGLRSLDRVHLPGSHRPPAVRAELLARSGDALAARTAYAEAIRLCGNDAERAHLRRRLAELG